MAEIHEGITEVSMAFGMQEDMSTNLALMDTSWDNATKNQSLDNAFTDLLECN